MQTVQEILDNADNECEGANYHHLVGLAERLYNSVSAYIEPADRMAVASALAKEVIDSF